MILGKPIASLTLQVIFYVDTYYTWLYFFLELSLFVYRGYTFNYSKLTIGFEILGVILLFCVQMSRLYFGSVGNKCEEIGPLLLMYLLSIPSVIGAIYFLYLQTYVLLADFLISIVLILFILAELFFGIFALIRFKSSEKDQ